MQPKNNFLTPSQIRDRLDRHRDAANTYLALTCIMGALGAFASVATAITAARQDSDGADFILGITAGALLLTAINSGILYHRAKQPIKKLQQELNHFKQK